MRFDYLGMLQDIIEDAPSVGTDSDDEDEGKDEKDSAQRIDEMV